MSFFICMYTVSKKATKMQVKLGVISLNTMNLLNLLLLYSPVADAIMETHAAVLSVHTDQEV
jgi:hypothetical protein